MKCYPRIQDYIPHSSFIAEEIGDTLVIGVVSPDPHEQSKWHNFVSNYKINRKKIYEISDRFFYFLTDKNNLISAFNLHFRNQLFLNGFLTGEEVESGALKHYSFLEARRFVDGIKKENIYRRSEVSADFFLINSLTLTQFFSL